MKGSVWRGYTGDGTGRSQVRELLLTRLSARFYIVHRIGQRKHARYSGVATQMIGVS